MKIEVEDGQDGVGISILSVGFDGGSKLFSLRNDEIRYRAEVQRRSVVGKQLGEQQFDRMVVDRTRIKELKVDVDSLARRIGSSAWARRGWNDE